MGSCFWFSSCSYLCKRSWTAASGHRRDFILGCPLAAAAAILSCKVQPDRWIAPHLAVRVLFDYGWALAAGLHPAPTCKRSWTAVGGHRRDFVLGCPLAAAAILSCKVQPERWIAPHVAVRALFDCGRWESWVTQPVRCTSLWPASWLPVVDETRGSKSAEVQRVWEIYDQFMSSRDALLLDESLGLDDVSMAWAVWSRAAEAALVDAFRFSGGPPPSRGLILGRGAALLRSVQLGGPRVRRARANAADALDAADIFLYCDFSLAPLLDMRRRFKAVMDLLDAMIRYGVSLSRSMELTAQWDQILALGPMYPVTLDDLSFGRDLGLCEVVRFPSSSTWWAIGLECAGQCC